MESNKPDIQDKSTFTYLFIITCNVLLEYIFRSSVSKPKPTLYEKYCGTIVSPIWLISYNVTKPFYNDSGIPSFRKIGGYNIIGKGTSKLPRKYKRKKRYNNTEHFTLIMNDRVSSAKFFVDEQSLQEYIIEYNESLNDAHLFCTWI